MRRDITLKMIDECMLLIFTLENKVQFNKITLLMYLTRLELYLFVWFLINSTRVPLTVPSSPTAGVRHLVKIVEGMNRRDWQLNFHVVIFFAGFSVLILQPQETVQCWFWAKMEKNRCKPTTTRYSWGYFLRDLVWNVFFLIKMFLVSGSA